VELAQGELEKPTLVVTNVTCDTPGCVATKTLEFELKKSLRAATLTIKVRQTDFDDDAELIEYILVNGETVRTNCNPGGPKIGGGKKTYCCSDRPVDILLTDLLTHFFFFYIKYSSTFFVQ
jgi:hypothetical protein